MDALLELIKRANAEAAPVVACADGSHHWKSEGGRRCPEDFDGCGQAVYRCAVCGTYDYGEKGGPGARDCATFRGCMARWTTATEYYGEEQEGATTPTAQEGVAK